MGNAGAEILHLEADVKATEGNPNGFAMGEFVPYLKIAYEIVPSAGGAAIQKGELMPMIASDGLHYGASVAMPKAGSFRLNYAIQPPSAGGLGRHSDPVTGVAPWWAPFVATFEWDYPGPPAAPSRGGRQPPQPTTPTWDLEPVRRLEPTHSDMGSGQSTRSPHFNRSGEFIGRIRPFRPIPLV